MKAEEFIELSMAGSKPGHPSTRRHEEHCLKNVPSGSQILC